MGFGMGSSFKLSFCVVEDEDEEQYVKIIVLGWRALTRISEHAPPTRNMAIARPAAPPDEMPPEEEAEVEGHEVLGTVAAAAEAL